MFYRTLAENSDLKIWHKMWFLGPCGIRRRKEKEDCFSHCNSFTSQHFSPQPQWQGKQGGSKWPRQGRDTIQVIVQIKFLLTLWPFSPYIFYNHWARIEHWNVMQFSGSEQQASYFVFTFIFSLTSSMYVYVFTVLFVSFGAGFSLVYAVISYLPFCRHVCIVNPEIATTFKCLHYLFDPSPLV